MRLKPGRLPSALTAGLAPIYCISGDEPLQVLEAQDAIRARARELGHVDREILQVDAGFDWSRLAAASGNLSLFGERRLLELRLPTARPGQEGGRAIAGYCKAPPPDTVLLITTGRLDRSAGKSAWVNAIDKAGVLVQVWPLGGRDLAGWLRQRMQGAGLDPSAEAVQLLVERSEGNLLAAAQEIDKLRLLLGSGPVSTEAVRGAVADSARYDVFDLGDAVLQGDVRRTLRVLQGLREEGEEPTLVLWSLSRDVRAVCLLRAGVREDEVLRSLKVFGPRQALVRAASRRGSAWDWAMLLHRCARVDRIIKGAESGNAWQALRELGVAIAMCPDGTAIHHAGA